MVKMCNYQRWHFNLILIDGSEMKLDCSLMTNSVYCEVFSRLTCFSDKSLFYFKLGTIKKDILAAHI